ncbi:MAG: 2-hydroxyhepta-2,4-diene-1,7-dioate isomerase, partial [Rhodospirillales bacterium]|nr:2-hydroxyhepta-2,4-diene-1,7-dioate isomerase [Rhodospirillales bacterium]
MKLLRYGDEGQEKWGVLDVAGAIRTLDDALQHVRGDALTPEWLAQLQRLDPAKLPLLKASHRIGP